MTVLVDRVIGLHRSLAAAGIPHAFGGALALAYAVHEPRGTVDIDVNVFVDPGHAGQVFDALPEGVARSAEDAAVAARDGQLRLWWGSTPIDVFFSYHPFHDRTATRAAPRPFADTTIPVLDPTDLVVFKAFFARTKDWADIEAVVDAGTADLGDAQRWVDDLLGEDSAAATRLRAVAARAPGPADEHGRPSPLRRPAGAGGAA